MLFPLSYMFQPSCGHLQAFRVFIYVRPRSWSRNTNICS